MLKDTIFQLKAIKANCIAHDMTFDAGVLDGCIGILEAMNDFSANQTKEIKNLSIRAKKLQDELIYTRKERDAAIADLTEFAQFYKRRSICDFCKHDSETSEECRSRCKDNRFINDCFEWRGYNKQFNEV